MALLDIPPWLNVTPGYFTSALEAGARAGLAVSAQAQRAQELAAERAQQMALAQERADREAEQTRQFESSHLLNIQKLAQEANELTQKQNYENARESRLMDFEKGKLAIDAARADTAEKRNAALDKMAQLRYDQAQRGLDLREKHDQEIEAHNRKIEELQQARNEKEKPVTVTQNVYDPDQPFSPIGTVRGTLEQLGLPGTKKILPPEKAIEFLKQANGDKEAARKMARDAGYTF